MVAIGQLTWQQYFAQLYANPDVEAEPHRRPRHERPLRHPHARRGRPPHRPHPNQELLGRRLAHRLADAAPIGHGLRLKLFRQNPELHSLTTLSNNGNEVAFGTIGNASTSEGMFFEALNAAGVLQVPMLVSVWDDHYGISVPA
jgi:hypothetical protein